MLMDDPKAQYIQLNLCRSITLKVHSIEIISSIFYTAMQNTVKQMIVAFS